MDHAFGIIPKTSSLCSRLPRLSPILSSRSSVVLHFTFRPRFCFYKFLNWRTISKQSLKIITIPCDELSQSRHFCNYHTGEEIEPVPPETLLNHYSLLLFWLIKSCSSVAHFWTFVNEIIKHMLFYVCFLLLNIIFQGWIHVVFCCV